MAVLLALAGRLARAGGTGGGGASPLRHERLALVLAAAAAILLALPPGFPLLPGGRAAGLFRVPPGGLSGRLALVLDLGLALAAAAGLERLRRAAPPRWLRWGAPAVLAVALVAFHLWAYSALRSPDDPAALDVLRWGWVHWHLRFALLAAALLALAAGTRWLAPAMALLIGVELVLAHGSANPPMPARLAFPSPPALAFLERQAGAEPAAGSPSGERGPTGERLVGAGKALLPNLASVYGLADVRVFNPLAPARYDRLLAPAIASWDGEIPLLDGRDHRRLYDRLGVRWLLLPPDAPCPAGTETAFEDASGRVCRRPAPRALVSVGGAAPTSLRPSPGGARWSAVLTPGPVAAAPGADAPAELLETGISWSPGWRVVVAGEDGTRGTLGAAGPRGPAGAAPTPLVTAELPAGTRRVDLLYRPAGFVAGMLCAALGVALLLGWSVGHRGRLIA